MAEDTSKKATDSNQSTDVTIIQSSTGFLKKSYQPTSEITTPPPTNQSSSGSGNSKEKE